MNHRRSYAVIIFVFGISTLFFPSCTNRSSKLESETQAATAATETLKSTAIVQGGEGPKWFELKAEGLIALKEPSEAALVPFEPWPLARRIVSFIIRDNLIVAASNRDGLLAFVLRKDGSTAIYKLSDPELCGSYSMSSLFLYEGAPVVLLYRDRFFLEPEAPAAEPRLLSLANGNPHLISKEIPAFAKFPSSEGWDIEAMVRNEKGRWYFRAVRGKEAGGESLYAMTEDLSLEASPSSAAAFRAAQSPLPPSKAEPVLRRSLSAAAAKASSHGVALALSPGQLSAEPYQLTASGEAASGQNQSGEVLSAWACSDGSRSYTAFADGKLTIAVGRDGPVVSTQLPTLPENYFYTGIAALSNMLVASWEEQDGWAVGAAGFVIVSIR